MTQAGNSGACSTRTPRAGYDIGFGLVQEGSFAGLFNNDGTFDQPVLVVDVTQDGDITWRRRDGTCRSGKWSQVRSWVWCCRVQPGLDLVVQENDFCSQSPPAADYGAPGGWVEHPQPRPEHDPRSAAQVLRYHTWQHVRPQSVGEHTHQLMRIVLTVAPDCRREVLVYVLSHDMGERRTGDLPYPVKKEMGNGRSVIDALDREAVSEMVSYWMLPRPPCVTPAEKALVKHCEYIEMAEWALGELELGNRHAQVVLDRCVQQVEATMEDLDVDARVRSGQYWRRRDRQHRATMGEVL